MFINQMLKKDLNERPCIEEIIYNDLFQLKAQLHSITLPLILNKKKIIHRYSLNSDIQITEFQKKLIGIKDTKPAVSKEQPARKPVKKLELKPVSSKADLDRPRPGALTSRHESRNRKGGVESRLKLNKDAPKKHENENDATKKLQAFKSKRTSI